ncbi:MAG TPA: hypothetical protein VHZ74_18525 [Bryobacteraceae bacterium]|jgi:hypothetical protein|nr:hypothetical protein [Bryobacteraceae bacterium]
MVVKIRFGRGPVVSGRPGKNSRMATLAASILTLFSLGCASLAMWRIGTDLEWAGDFVFPSGLFSHWQVWAGAAFGIQYLGWKLTRYAKRADPPADAEPGKSSEAARVIANV